MNMQAMMKQAQQLQKKMLEEKNAIDNQVFEGNSSMVKVYMKGDYKLNEVKFDLSDDFSVEDFEMLQDMVMIAVNDAISKIKKETENKMGKYTQGIPGLF